MVVVNCTALSLMSFPTVDLSSGRSTCCPKSEISLSIHRCLALCHDSIGTGAEGVGKHGMARNGILPAVPVQTSFQEPPLIQNRLRAIAAFTSETWSL